MPTDIQICNQALAHLGEQNFIQTLDEGSTQAELCDIYYSQSRDELLRMHPWSFATLTRSLGLSTATPPTRWAYVYDYPTDCVRVLRIDDRQRARGSYNRIPFEIIREASTGRRLICCDDPELKLVFILRDENTNNYPPDFVNALSWLLAKKLAMPLTKKPDVYSYAQNEFIRAFEQAATMDNNEEQTDREPGSEFEVVRQNDPYNSQYRSSTLYWRY